MKTADFLFPRDLQVTPTVFHKLLFIGSCLSRDYVIKLREKHPECVIDYDLFNNATDLPQRTDAQLLEYNFQYIQLPLRSVLTDGIIRFSTLNNGDEPDWVAIGKSNIDMMLEKALEYNRRVGILSFVSNFIVPQGMTAPSYLEQGGMQDISFIVRELNKYLARKVQQLKSVFIADVDMIASSLGKRYFLDDMIGFYTHGSLFYTDWSGHEKFPHWTAPSPGRIEPIPDLALTYENNNSEFFDAVFRQIEALYRVANQMDMVKLVIFDLDNTLWRGQLVEHYQAGLKPPYSDGWPLGIWEAVHHLKRRGIVVSIASKNDEELVREKWSDAVNPPFVSFDDFIIPQINWSPKAENIATILKSLSLTPKSVVFVDDNPVERESVRAAFPAMRVIGSDPFVIRRVLLCAPETQILTRSEESMRRDTMLRQQVERESEREQMSREEFLMSLQSRIDFHELKNQSDKNYARVVELVNKTNQFNTTGYRWNHEEFVKHWSENGRIYYFSVRDRFSDYGVVGVIFTCEHQIKQMVMSCRVLGMEIENAAVVEIVKKIRSEYPKEIVGIIRFTEANMPSRAVFSKIGFLDNGDNYYKLGAIQEIQTPRHIACHFN